jgi:hypothetical protein
LKPHPNTGDDAAILAQAHHFEISLFLGQGRYARAEAPSIEEARSKAETLLRDHPGCTRRPIVYAVTAAGRAAPVDSDAKVKTELSGMQISRLAALVAGTTAARPSSKDTAINRFLKSTEQLIPAVRAYAILAMPFETAKAEIEALLPLTRSEMPAPLPLAPQAEDTSQSGLEATKEVVTSRSNAPPKPQTKAAGPMSKRAVVEAAADKGILPEPPDFTATTHTRFRKKLAALVELAQQGDLEALHQFPINPVSSSPKAMNRYRNLCVRALEARLRAG